MIKYHLDFKTLFSFFYFSLICSSFLMFFSSAVPLTAAAMLPATSLESRKNKIGNIQIANLDQITARKIWSHISNVGNSNTARLVKSHCKIIVDWACHHHSLEIPTNPFGFSAPRISKVSRDRVFPSRN